MDNKTLNNHSSQIKNEMGQSKISKSLMLKIAGRISCELLGGSNTGYVNEIFIYSVREMAGTWMELLPLASSEVDGIKGAR